MTRLKDSNIEMFKIGDDENGQYIECNWCSYKSHNPNDIKFKYCGACCRFLVPVPIHKVKRVKPDNETLFDINKIPKE